MTFFFTHVSYVIIIGETAEKHKQQITLSTSSETFLCSDQNTQKD